ncbi:kmo [Symbiodinium natans]|uniref:Kmo protein n=1 Tax=Symbiodinium natans TaxID=878477 RepID=A0A812HUS5_9DINO|nr:kmo [Symbiodinium natans]
MSESELGAREGVRGARVGHEGHMHPEGAKLLLSSAAAEEELEQKRAHLLEGIPILSASPSVSSCQRRCLAFLRTIIFLAATVGILWVQCWFCESLLGRHGRLCIFVRACISNARPCQTVKPSR